MTWTVYSYINNRTKHIIQTPAHLYIGIYLKYETGSQSKNGYVFCMDQVTQYFTMYYLLLTSHKMDANMEFILIDSVTFYMMNMRGTINTHYCKMVSLPCKKKGISKVDILRRLLPSSCKKYLKINFNPAKFYGSF